MSLTRMFPRLLAVLLAMAFASGCATPITVTSSPEGAAVYCRGSGRPSYRWKFRGNTPVTFKIPYNAVQTFVQWPGVEGQKSEIRYDNILFHETAKFHFEQETK